MASTNKTTNYDLSQYVGTDKPTYLGDYNSDMIKIDTAIHEVNENVNSESAKINIIENNIGTMSNLQTSDKTNIVNAVNEVNNKAETNKTNIGTLENLETTNKTTIVNAINDVIEKFNLTHFETFGVDDVIPISGTRPTNFYCDLTVASNEDGSICKIYGRTGAVPASDYNFKIQTRLRPKSDITINGVRTRLFQRRNDNSYFSIYQSSFTIATDGTITIGTTYSSNPTSENQIDIYSPVVLFVKDFGDTTIPE